MAPNRDASFWERMGLRDGDRDVCLAAIQSVYHGYRIQEFKEQGYCSFTLLVTVGEPVVSTSSTRTLSKEDPSSRMICQIRPEPLSLDMEHLRAARRTYGAFAPWVKSLDVVLPGRMKAFEMDVLSGTPLSRVLPWEKVLNEETRRKQETLVVSFAKVIASGLRCTEKEASSRYMRADSPMAESDPSNPFPQCTGKVGALILPKLSKLAQDLPDADLRWRARDTLERVQLMRDYPVVLNHGDLIPTNILVDEKSWEVTGLVDWAEAEYLPFGTCLYGVEMMLGYLVRSSCPVRGRVAPGFVYYDCAERLRGMFWKRFMEELHSFGFGAVVSEEEVRVIRDVGVFLWYGYAWDEGRIDRVVNEKDDEEEVECLRAFLAL